MMQYVLAMLQAALPAHKIGNVDEHGSDTDPLSHPAITLMDARELGDLPFSRGEQLSVASKSDGAR